LSHKLEVGEWHSLASQYTLTTGEPTRGTAVTIGIAFYSIVSCLSAKADPNQLSASLNLGTVFGIGCSL